MAEAVVMASADPQAGTDRRRAAAEFCRRAVAEGCDDADKMLALAGELEACAKTAAAAAGGVGVGAEPEPELEEPVEYTLMHRTVVRAGADLESKRAGALRPGTVVRLVGRLLLPPAGPLRLELAPDGSAEGAGLGGGHERCAPARAARPPRRRPRSASGRSGGRRRARGCWRRRGGRGTRR